MRLTYRNEKGDAYVQLCSAPNKAIGNVAERAEKERAVIERLAYYEDLDEQGRLIELPCAVGDIVYTIDIKFPIVNGETKREYCIIEGVVREFHIRKDNIYITIEYGAPNSYFTVPDISEVGRKTFCTREAAEAALKERENK